MIGGRIVVRVFREAPGSHFVATIMDGWWMAVGNTRESAVNSVIKRYEDDPLDCGHVCDHVEPYGFVPEAGCPVHDPESVYTCPHCGSELEEGKRERLTPKLVSITLSCPQCAYQIDLTRPEEEKTE
jgi:hypothetical protein